MIAPKHLRELLKEDQEPFLHKTNSRLNPLNLCCKSCIFSCQNSRDLIQSPPCKPRFPQILSRIDTVQKSHSCSNPYKSYAKKIMGLDLFGSILKKFSRRNRGAKTLKGCSDLGFYSKFDNAGVSNGEWYENPFDIEPCCLRDLDSVQNSFCESPFRFVLQANLSSGGHKPEISTNRHVGDEKPTYEAGVEVDKEQSSPVSVLDPQFNITILQRAKRSSCFEKLETRFKHVSQISIDIERLLWDLVEEETLKLDQENNETIVKRVCETFETWKTVESNTIDMMIEMDFRNELDIWKENRREINDFSVEVEGIIFELLVDELTRELASLILCFGF